MFWKLNCELTMFVRQHSHSSSWYCQRLKRSASYRNRLSPGLAGALYLLAFVYQCSQSVSAPVPSFRFVYVFKEPDFRPKQTQMSYNCVVLFPATNQLSQSRRDMSAHDIFIVGSRSLQVTCKKEISRVRFVRTPG